MSYTKPNTFNNAASLDADDINGNDEELKIWTNQKSITSDLANDAFGTEEIQLGDYQPITNEYTFATGIDSGIANGIEPSDRAYWTSNVKKGRETDANLKIWLGLAETSPQIDLEQAADLVITFGGTFISNDNDVNPNGYWDSQLKLGYIYNNNTTLTFVEQTRSYSFEETVPSSASPLGVYSPFGAMATPSGAGDEDPEIARGCRRWIGWTAILRNLPAGTYKFVYYVDPKTEEGFTSARSFKCEVFYK